ncbi:TonB-dependent receptor [Wenyingzhuangia aestuarii]|uniref:TonB-dependent receptor n=1 Tax=Wenyingzhuangia aestuarii TaxID=1647582 RepID=UPI001FD7A7F8|nr:carboxypeptidase-like regulatory domain-containing protein [Wenyingzhuangia aestuarii]
MKQSKLLFILCVAYSCFSFAIPRQEKIQLIHLLPKLEAKFDVKFSYAVEDVTEVWVTTPNENFTLKQVVAFLNSSTILNFKFLTERYITVSTLQKTITICGVLRTKNKAPIVGASVMVVNTGKGIVTNVNGNFKLENIDVNADIRISYFGYQTLNLKAKEIRTCKEIELLEQAEMLNPIVISKFLTTGLQKRMDGSTVLNTEKFGVLPGLTDPDVLQSIQALPGVESVNESIANINVRGGSNDQNLILWDGIKMYHAGHFFGLISAYNPNLTNKVVVTKNGTSSEFSDGVSSTINMFTKDEIGKEIKGGFGLNLLNTDAFLEIPISKKMAVHVSGRRSFTDVYTSPTYNTYFKRSFQDSQLTNTENINESNKSSDFYFYDYTAKLLYYINSKHKIRANIIGIYNNLDYLESYTDAQNQTTSKTNNLQQQNFGAGFQWNAIWTSKFTTDVVAFYSKYNIDAVDYRIESDQKLTQANEVIETGLKLNTRYKIHQNVSFLNGYQFSETGILNQTTVNLPSYSKTKKDVLLNHALFSEIEFNNRNTYIRLGLRVNYFQKFNKFIIEPRLNFRQKLNKQWAVKLQGEFKNQSATQVIDFQDNFLGVEKRRWILANNQDIPISKSKQGSLGLEYHHHNWVLSTDGFYKLVDGITASNQGFYNSFQNLSATGSYQVKGIEFLVNKTAHKYSTWFSYTYSVNQYEFKSFIPSVFPNNVDIKHSVSMAFNYYLLENLELSLGGILRSGQPYTKPIEGEETIQNGNNTVVNYDVPNNENLASFMRLDASLKYHFKWSNSIKSSLIVGVMNVTNRENIINRYYQVDPNNSGVAIQVNHKSLGFMPNVSLRIKF